MVRGESARPKLYRVVPIVKTLPRVAKVTWLDFQYVRQMQGPVGTLLTLRLIVRFRRMIQTGARGMPPTR